MKSVLAAGAGLAAALATAAGAAPITTSVTASGPYQGDLAVLTDGVVPPLGAYYAADYTVHDYGSTVFTFAFNGLTHVTDFLASFDNNDDYTVTFYNGATAVSSIVVPVSAGTIGNGMDSFSSNGAPGTSQIGASFNVDATRAVVSTSGGDGYYAIGEVQFFNNATPGVPEPASWATMMAGFGLVGAAARRRSARMVQAI